MKPGECPDEDTLLDQVGGRVRGRALAELEGHLDRCPACLDVVADALRDEPAGGAR